MTVNTRPESLKVLVSAGEASADLCAADVLKRLAELVEQPLARGMGGGALAAAGMKLDFDLRRTTAMGGVEVAARLPQIVRAWVGLLALARRWRPDVLLAVDLPDFNVPLARLVKGLGVPVLGYVAPQFWAWRPGRLRHLSRSFDHVASVLPFECGPLRRAGVEATFVGHPLLDREPPTRFEARRALGIGDDQPCVALLPGSRPAEISRLLTPMLRAARDVRRRRNAAVLVAVASSLDRPPDLPSWCEAVTAQRHRRPGAIAMAAADVALVASGMATLEAALAEVPLIAVCRLGRSTYVTARAIVRCRHFALPNLVLGRRDYPELLQRAVTAASMADHVVHFLDHPEIGQRQRRSSQRLRELLKGPGASRTTAKLLLELVGAP